ncbi:glycosyltransferase family 39 protein [Parapedobacter lycopersici]|uniref:glycosyltransferase family 39 protein n=1 Tax=Parapedobacter lycopersici TaxID=1864939 RepID=UPI00214DC0C7|nr:glycosyltransferase family 39 protein [Parapedobacter lycopersici]
MSSLTKNNYLIFYFLLIWMGANLFQAAFMELHVDETYYWVYSQFLDWGYYDHPPMVALFMKAGDTIFHSALMVRLLSVLTNVAAIAILWQLVKSYVQDASLFVILYSSMLILHVYSFITTPDTPLFFFTIVYFYLLKRYIKTDRLTNALLLAVVIAGMLYSKYHAVLVLLFTIVADLKLLKRPSFWLIVAISGVLFVPHILWQINHDLPSVQYHLFERSARAYRFSFTTDFILSQLLIVGPFAALALYYYVFRQRATDIFLRIMKFNCYGFLLFFLISTFKGRVEAHWTLLAFVPFFILAYIHLGRMEHIPRWVMRLLYANIALIIVIRIVLIFPIPALTKIRGLQQFWGKNDMAKRIHAKAGENYVIMDNGFQDISNYNFVNNTTKGFSYNTRNYRKTQYDFWPIEDSLRNHKAYYATFRSHGTPLQDTIQTIKGPLYGRFLDAVRTYQKVNIKVEGLRKEAEAGSKQYVTLTINNPYQDTISFSNADEQWPVFLEYGYTQPVFQEENFVEMHGDYRNIIIPPGETATFPAKINMPPSPGKYMLLFSIRTDPFTGARNSDKFPIRVN